LAKFKFVGLMLSMVLWGLNSMNDFYSSGSILGGGV